jgi:hypothetical protein
VGALGVQVGDLAHEVKRMGLELLEVTVDELEFDMGVGALGPDAAHGEQIAQASLEPIEFADEILNGVVAVEGHGIVVL